MNQTRVNARLDRIGSRSAARSVRLRDGQGSAARGTGATGRAELPPEVRVGLLLPLSGSAGALGRDMLDAAQMALFDVGDNDLVLLPRDTGDTPEGARTAAARGDRARRRGHPRPAVRPGGRAVSPTRHAGRHPGTGLLERRLGRDRRHLPARLSSGGAGAPGDRLRAGERRAVAPRAEPLPGQDAAAAAAAEAAPDMEQPTLAQPPSDQGVLDPQSVRIAGLAPDDAYGATALEALRGAVVEGGGELGETLLYPPDLADPSAVVRRDRGLRRTRRRRSSRTRAPRAERRITRRRRGCRRSRRVDTVGGPPFDAILIADGGDRLRSVASLLTFFDVDPATTRFLGTMRWQDDPRVLAEEALQGGWFAASAPDDLAAFENRFRDTFGRPPAPARRARLRRHRARGDRRARSGRSQLRHEQPHRCRGLRRRHRAVPAAPGRPDRARPRRARGERRHGAHHRSAAHAGSSTRSPPCTEPTRRSGLLEAHRQQPAERAGAVAALCLSAAGISPKVWPWPSGTNIGS